MIRIPKATKATREAIAEYATLMQRRKVRVELETLLFKGFTIARLLPSDLFKVSPQVRDALAEQYDGIILPTDWQKPSRETGETMRTYLAKYIVPVWPEFGEAWDSMILVPSHNTLYGRGE